jgi:hypothetical protein
MAFDVLDKDRNGVVEPADIVAAYDASRHPAVLSGAKTAASVLREFLDTFDVGGEVDGKVTKEEFMNYYSNISASIDDDDYFELMIRNAWHISGGVGQAANSANRRVLVTDAQGQQVVQEIRQDLGLQQNDKAGMVARLRAQGIDAVSIDRSGSSGNKDLSSESRAQLERVNAEVAELRAAAAKAFSKGGYAEAEQFHTKAKALLLTVHKSALHPDVFQSEKSIQMCKTKIGK